MYLETNKKTHYLVYENAETKLLARVELKESQYESIKQQKQKRSQCIWLPDGKDTEISAGQIKQFRKIESDVTVNDKPFPCGINPQQLTHNTELKEKVMMWTFEFLNEYRGKHVIRQNGDKIRKNMVWINSKKEYDGLIDFINQKYLLI